MQFSINSSLCSIQQIQQLSKKEIEDLLRKGAYAAIMDENDEGSRFCEEDIDQILQRRATTITIESEGKGSTFSKASFVASENRNDIALDDPEFWQKWAKKADIDMDSINRKVTLLFFVKIILIEVLNSFNHVFFFRNMYLFILFLKNIMKNPPFPHRTPL